MCGSSRSFCIPKADAHFPASAIWKDLVAAMVRWRGNQRLDEWKTVGRSRREREVIDGVKETGGVGWGGRGLPLALGTPSAAKGFPLFGGGGVTARR